MNDSKNFKIRRSIDKKVYEFRIESSKNVKFLKKQDNSGLKSSTRYQCMTQNTLKQGNRLIRKITNFVLRAQKTLIFDQTFNVCF